MRRRILLLVGLLGLGVGGYLGYRWWKGGDVPVTYTTQPAARGDVIQAVTASGTLSPVVVVEVGTQVGGRIQELLVDYNDHVTVGQIVARIDPQTTQSALVQAQARLTAARSDYTKAKAAAANAKIEAERAVELGKSGAISRSDIDAAQLAYNSASASVTGANSSIVEAQAALTQAKTNLTYTTIKSPVDGTVISRAVNVGQTVSAATSAPTLFTIAGDLKQMEVHTSVAESDVGQLAEGMRTEFTVDAFPEDVFVGKVKQVRYEATTVQNVVTYDAVVEVDNAQLKLRPGMTANVTFVIAEAKDVLAVAAKALRYRPPGADAGSASWGGGSGSGGSGSGGRRWRGGGGDGGGSGGAGSGAAGSGDAGGRRNRDGNRDGSAGAGSGSGGGGSGGDSSGGSDASGGSAVANANGSAGGGGGGGNGRRRQRQQAVWVLRQGKPVRVAVQVGLSDGTTTEISGGELVEGDLVIVADSTTKSGAAATNRPSGGAFGGGAPRRRGGGGF